MHSTNLAYDNRGPGTSPKKPSPKLPRPPIIPAPLEARELKARADFVAIASRYTRLRRSGQQHVGLCPFHSERHPSFYVQPEKKIFYCFGCGAGGDLFDFVMRAEGCEFLYALKIVAESLGEATEARRFLPGRGSEGAKPPGLRSRPSLIARKPEPGARSFSALNHWPSVEYCAAEAATEAERAALFT